LAGAAAAAAAAVGLAALGAGPDVYAGGAADAAAPPGVGAAAPPGAGAPPGVPVAVADANEDGGRFGRPTRLGSRASCVGSSRRGLTSLSSQIAAMGAASAALNVSSMSVTSPNRATVSFRCDVPVLKNSTCVGGAAITKA
jgi:hypothetical protein